MRTILVTVGTSLLSNARQDLGLKTEELDEQRLSCYLRSTSLEKASAETNSLSRILQEGDRIVFLHSQTEEGKKCAEVLRRHYEKQRYQVDLQEVSDLAYTESRFKMRGLRSLVAALIEHIKKERCQGRGVLINATGGFKAEVAYATLVGLLFDVPIYYIHEVFREIIEMPPMPLSWDYSLLANYEEFFEWIAADLRPTGEVDQKLRGLPEEVRLLLTEEEDYTLLSPAGEAFYEAYRDRLQSAEAVPILLSPSAWRTYEDAEPSIQQSYSRVLSQLRLREIRVSNSRRVGESDCLVFPEGHRDERVFYYEGDDGSIRVCELGRHSDKSYEGLIKRGVLRSNYPEEKFRKWTTP